MIMDRAALVFGGLVVMGSLLVACAGETDEDELSAQTSEELTATSLDRYLDIGVSCIPAVCGDVNGDGKVTVTDGVIASRIAAGLVVAKPGSCAFWAADVDRSGAVSVTDAVNIQRAAAGLPAKLTCNFGPITKYPR